MKRVHNTNRVKSIFILNFLIVGIIAACSSTPAQAIPEIQEIEVTRIVEVEVEVTRPVEIDIEVTRIVEREADLSDIVIHRGISGGGLLVNYSNDEECNKAMDKAVENALDNWAGNPSASVSLAVLPAISISYFCFRNVANTTVVVVDLSKTSADLLAQQVRDDIEADLR